MGYMTVPLVNSSQTLSSNLTEFKKTDLIQYAHDYGVGSSTGNKKLDGGYHLNWTGDKNVTFEDEQKNLFAKSVQDGGLRIKVKEGGQVEFIVFQDTSISRHLPRITQIGWEHFQSSSSNHSLHLQYVAREWKHPTNGRKYTYGDSWNGEANKDTMGYFHTVRNVTSQEELYINSGYFLGGIWFKLRTTSGVGSATSSWCDIYNMRFGWGEGEPSTNHKMVLPKIRVLEQANQLAFGG